jgi:hypothetical protein
MARPGQAHASPVRTPRAAAAAREERPSSRSMLARCRCPVCSLSTSRRAMPGFAQSPRGQRQHAELARRQHRRGLTLVSPARLARCCVLGPGLSQDLPRGRVRPAAYPAPNASTLITARSQPACGPRARPRPHWPGQPRPRSGRCASPPCHRCRPPGRSRARPARWGRRPPSPTGIEVANAAVAAAADASRPEKTAASTRASRPRRGPACWVAIQWRDRW